MMQMYLVKEAGIGSIPGVYPGIPKGSVERFSLEAAARVLRERPEALEVYDPEAAPKIKKTIAAK